MNTVKVKLTNPKGIVWDPENKLKTTITGEGEHEVESTHRIKTSIVEGALIEIADIKPVAPETGKRKALAE